MGGGGYPVLSNQLDFLIFIISNRVKLSSDFGNQLKFWAILSNRLSTSRPRRSKHFKVLDISAWKQFQMFAKFLFFKF